MGLVTICFVIHKNVLCDNDIVVILLNREYNWSIDWSLEHLAHLKEMKTRKIQINKITPPYNRKMKTRKRGKKKRKNQLLPQKKKKKHILVVTYLWQNFSTTNLGGQVSRKLEGTKSATYNALIRSHYA